MASTIQTLLVIFSSWTQYEKSSYPLTGACSRLSQKLFCFPVEIAPERNSYLALSGRVVAASHNTVLLRLNPSWSFKGGFLGDIVGCWREGEPWFEYFFFQLFHQRFVFNNLSSRDRGGAVWPISFGSHFPVYLTELVAFWRWSLTICWCSRWGRRRKRAFYLPIQPLSEPASWVTLGLLRGGGQTGPMVEASTKFMCT